MGHWNYRICKETYNPPDGGAPIVHYSVREAYYNDDGSIWGVTENAVGIVFSVFPEEPSLDVVDETRLSLERMMQALDRPILDLDTIEYAQQQYFDEDDDADLLDIEGDLGLDNTD